MQIFTGKSQFSKRDADIFYKYSWYFSFIVIHFINIIHITVKDWMTNYPNCCYEFGWSGSQGTERPSSRFFSYRQPVTGWPSGTSWEFWCISFWCFQVTPLSQLLLFYLFETISQGRCWVVSSVFLLYFPFRCAKSWAAALDPQETAISHWLTLESWLEVVYSCVLPASCFPSTDYFSKGLLAFSVLGCRYRAFLVLFCLWSAF